ncbi:hypothetical protein F511_22505 [Dorcoceras hygrometricum]|uniref:Uncharacterized protein n=1 Tax=Dorcoceras hygrometricum TaxID=472368 RepID=A0A2Z7CUK4_9LAMI|nr:hypothetical protein F511_22505 [Dorcoceras hygrometricum]
MGFVQDSFLQVNQVRNNQSTMYDEPPLPPSLTPPPPPPCAAVVFVGKIVSGQLDEENPFVLILSGLLVQPDEGVSDLVVDRIGVNYSNLPRRAGFLKHRLEPGTSASEIQDQNLFHGLPAAAARGGARNFARMSARLVARAAHLVAAESCWLEAHWLRDHGGWTRALRRTGPRKMLRKGRPRVVVSLAAVSRKIARCCALDARHHRAGRTPSWPAAAQVAMKAGRIGGRTQMVARRWLDAGRTMARDCRGPRAALRRTNFHGGAAGRPPLRRGSGDIPDEGVSDLVVDRIGVNYRNLPRRAGFLKHRLEPGTAVFAGKIVSGQLDEENPFVLISSGLLVQPDEGVSDLVVDRIGVNYRNLPRRAGFLKHRLEPGTSASEPGGGSGSPTPFISKSRPNNDHWEHCDVLSMQMDSDLVIYRTTLVRTFQVVTICRLDKSESTGCILGKWVCVVTLVMSLFDLQDVCIAIGSLATLDLPMVVDLIGIYVLKGPYCTLTTTNWFLQALSVIPKGSWGDVARRFTMIRWTSPKLRFRSRNGCGPTASCIPEPLRVTQVLYS